MDTYKGKEKISRDRSNSTEGRKSRSTSKSKKRKYNKQTGSTDSSSSSSGSDNLEQVVKHKHKHREKSRKRKKRRHRSNSESSPDRKSEKRKKKKKKRKSEKHKKRKHKNIEVEEEKKTAATTLPVTEEPSQAIGPAIELDTQTRKSMKPMTKEDWDKQQSIVRRVTDPETGRQRLIKGDGEVIEEIVSNERQREINKQATLGDGLFFQAQVGLLEKAYM